MNWLRHFWILITFGSLSAAVPVVLYFQSLDGPRPVLRFEYRTSHAVKTRIDFDYGEGWATNDRIRWVFEPTLENWQSEEFMLSQKSPKKMKMNLDPIPGSFEIRNLRLLVADGSGREIPIDLEKAKPVAETDAYSIEGEELRIALNDKKVPSFSLPVKENAGAWEHSLFQAPFGSRLLRGWILIFLSTLAIWGPAKLWARNDPK